MVVQALNVPLIDQTAELLASSFITSVATLAPYAQYVRRNIRRYLHEHQALPLKAVVLVAVLHPFCAIPATAEVIWPDTESVFDCVGALRMDGPCVLFCNKLGPANELESSCHVRFHLSALAAHLPLRAVVHFALNPITPDNSNRYGALYHWPNIPSCGALSKAGVMTVANPSISVAGNGVEPALATSSLPRVIGSAEVSFDPSTRSPQMFVDAPEVGSASVFTWWST